MLELIIHSIWEDRFFKVPDKINELIIQIRNVIVILKNTV